MDSRSRLSEPRQVRFAGAGFADHRQRAPAGARRTRRRAHESSRGSGRRHARRSNPASNPWPRGRRSRRPPSTSAGAVGIPATKGVEHRARPSAGSAGGGSTSWQASKTKRSAARHEPADGRAARARRPEWRGVVVRSPAPRATPPEAPQYKDGDGSAKSRVSRRLHPLTGVSNNDAGGGFGDHAHVRATSTSPIPLSRHAPASKTRAFAPGW